MVITQNDAFLQHHAHCPVEAPWMSPESRCGEGSGDLEVFLVAMMLALKFNNHQELLGTEKTLKTKGGAGAKAQKHVASGETQGALLRANFSQLNSSFIASGMT